MTYNIWNGFAVKGADDTRKARVIEWLNKERPDVLALQELCGYTSEKLKEDGEKWGHSYSLLLKDEGYSVGITSRYPIVLKERILEDMHHGALHCVTKGIDFFVVHLSPFEYKVRRREAKILLAKLSEVAGGQDKYIVLGDFNAVSPFDADLYKGNSELLKKKNDGDKTYAHVENMLNGEFEYGVISSFLGFPLIDVCLKYTSGLEGRVSCPTRVFSSIDSVDKSTRIDYILASPSLAVKCRNAKVCNQEENYYLSDHYPVYCEFNID